MNHLVVYNHPNPKSFCHAIKETVVETGQNLGHEVQVRDLYALNFDPVLAPEDFEAMQKGGCRSDVQDEQEAVTWANHITFIYPIWWTGLPARMKGYIDRVYSHGFAYAFGPKGQLEQKLKDKSAIIVNTNGMPFDVYTKNGMYDSLKQTSDTGIFAFCGVRVLDHIFFGGVPSVSDEVRKGYLETVRTRLPALFD